MTAILEVLSVFWLVFAHSLTVSFLALTGLAIGLAQPVVAKASLQTALRVFAGVTVAGLAIIAVGLWSVNGHTSATPSYVHGLACVYGMAAGITATWMLGRSLRACFDRVFASRLALRSAKG